MKHADAYISIKLDLTDPVEISDFAALFAGFGADFDRYLQQEHPKLAASARMYVREVRKGSVVADMFASIPDMIGLMNDALIILAFVGLFNKRVQDYVLGKPSPGATKSALRDLTSALRAVAQDKDGKLTLQGFRYREGAFHKELEAAFTTKEAREALKTIERQRGDLDVEGGADYSRVLMVFTRSDIGDAKIGKRSGERVRIDEISPKHLALMYGSELAEERIKHEIRETDENVFKKGFVFDVNVKLANGKPAAYSVTNLHEIIELPDDD